MAAAVGKGFRWFVVVALLASLPAQPGPEPERASRPVTYPIAAEGEAERTHLSPNFSVTWIHDASSPDAPALRDKDHDEVPDSVETLLGAFESARSFLIGQLGYRPPPVAGTLPVYVAARDGSAIAKPAPGGEGPSKPSFIVIPSASLRRSLSPRQLRITAVHEYFHAVQNGYDSDYDHWIGEATAAWMEDVFDDRADSNHRYLRDFVPYPRRGLTDTTGQHEYGAFLFIQFLVERYANGNPGLVRELWEQMAAPEAGGPGLGSLEAVEAVLARRGAPLAQAWAEFQLWRWDLDRFEEGEAYQSALGNTWPKPLQTTEVLTESCRLSSEFGSGLPPLSGEYSVFRPGEKPDSARATVTVEGPPGTSAFVLTHGDGGREKSQLLQVGESGLAAARVRFGDEQVRRVVLGVGNPVPAGSAARIDYSLRIDGRNAVTAEALEPPAETHFFGGLTLRGRVLCNGQPSPLADVLLVQDKRSGEQRTFDLTTAAGGVWTRTFEPEQTSTYHVEVADPLLSPAASQPWDVGVRVALLLEVPDPEVTLGQPVLVEGKIGPPHPGTLVRIDYRRPDLSWRSGPQTTADADGMFRASVALPAEGIWHLRAVVAATGDDDHLGNTTINDVFVNVR